MDLATDAAAAPVAPASLQVDSASRVGAGLGTFITTRKYPPRHLKGVLRLFQCRLPFAKTAPV